MRVKKSVRVISYAFRVLSWPGATKPASPRRAQRIVKLQVFRSFPPQPLIIVIVLEVCRLSFCPRTCSLSPPPARIIDDAHHDPMSCAQRQAPSTTLALAINHRKAILAKQRGDQEGNPKLSFFPHSTFCDLSGLTKV